MSKKLRIKYTIEKLQDVFQAVDNTSDSHTQSATNKKNFTSINDLFSAVEERGRLKGNEKKILLKQRLYSLST